MKSKLFLYAIVLNTSLLAMEIEQTNKALFDKTVRISPAHRIVNIITEEYHELRKINDKGNGYSHKKYLIGAKRDKVEFYVVAESKLIGLVEDVLGLPGIKYDPKKLFDDLLVEFNFYSNEIIK